MSKLSNYLKMYRKRSGLTQEELGYLLGHPNGSKVSRYENNSTVPTLTIALAYEYIFQVPVRDLFAGLFTAVEKKTLTRIGHLGGKLGLKAQTPLIKAKLDTLAAAVRKSRGPEEQ